ncbi:hypothetical protein BC829DRAFT_105102 [Chytridium lagenaria]|nr:hypothetical protein BC829DRAFT_105102 [Chytridium lagenaria]
MYISNLHEVSGLMKQVATKNSRDLLKAVDELAFRLLPICHECVGQLQSALRQIRRTEISEDGSIIEKYGSEALILSPPSFNLTPSSSQQPSAASLPLPPPPPPPPFARSQTSQISQSSQLTSPSSPLLKYLESRNPGSPRSPDIPTSALQTQYMDLNLQLVATISSSEPHPTLRLDGQSRQTMCSLRDSLRLMPIFQSMMFCRGEQTP